MSWWNDPNRRIVRPPAPKPAPPKTDPPLTTILPVEPAAGHSAIHYFNHVCICACPECIAHPNADDHDVIMCTCTGCRKSLCGAQKAVKIK